MKRKTTIAAAGTLALTMAVGGLLWGDYHVQAEENQTQTEAPRPGAAKFKFSAGTGIAQWEEKLADFLKLDDDELRQQLQTKSIAEVAEEQGIARSEMKEQIVAWIQEQAPEAAETMLDAKGRGAMPEDLRRGGGGFRMTMALDGISESLGMSQEELQEALGSGQTVAALAEEKGTDIQTIIDKQAAAMLSMLDEKLADGTMTQAQYEERKAHIVDHITKMVNGETAGDPGMQRFGGKHGGPGGMKPFPKDSAPAAQSETP